MKPYPTDDEVPIFNDVPRDGKSYSRKAGKWVPISSDYEVLENKPAIDGIELSKESTATDLGLETAADAEAMEERITGALDDEIEARETHDEEQEAALAAEITARETHDQEQDAKISTLNGAYYVLDAYDFGKTLDETDPDDILILNTYAIANTPGASSMADVYNDTVIINEFDTSEFVYNKISGLWVKYPNGYLTIATNDHLGVVKGTQPPTDPTDETKDTFVQILPDGSMRLVGDRLGKINTVNGISPDTNKNVQTDYIYKTEADFEADKDNIPIGATVIKMYEYPDNHSYDINRPDLWPANTEIDFGGGLYGQRFTGTITADANSNGQKNLFGNSQDVVSSGGWVVCGGVVFNKIALGHFRCKTNFEPEFSSFLGVAGSKTLILRTYSVDARTNAPYDVWATYTK